MEEGVATRGWGDRTQHDGNDGDPDSQAGPFSPVEIRGEETGERRGAERSQACLSTQPNYGS